MKEERFLSLNGELNPMAASILQFYDKQNSKTYL